MKIALLGQFGSGNIGNDGSLKAMIEYLREYVPDAELLCICSRPEIIEKTLRLPAVSISKSNVAPIAGNPFRTKVSRYLRTAKNMKYAFNHAKGCDLIIIPGTGILDDFKELPSGWPFCLLRWSAAARLSRTPLLFVSVGAGPIDNWLSRQLFTNAARGAAYISYRDQTSLKYMSDHGFSRNDSVYPDIVFRLGSHDQIIQKATTKEKPCVGLGIMNYSGWSKKDGTRNNQLADRYLSEITNLARLLVSSGSRVKLLTGGMEDRETVERLLEASRYWPDCEGEHELSANEINSLDDLRNEIAETDIVVASRYHNIVCSLAMAKPTISLAYSSKNDAIMLDFGLGEYSCSIDDFVAHDVYDMIMAAHAKSSQIAIQSSLALRNYRRRLTIQDQRIAKSYLFKRDGRNEDISDLKLGDQLRCE